MGVKAGHRGLVAPPNARMAESWQMDQKEINQSIPHQPFKMVSLQAIFPLIQSGDFLTSIDMLDAHLHIPIHMNFQKFLRFAVRCNHYQFQVLPFGLASAPSVLRKFMKLLHPLVGILYARGIQVYPYLDD